MTKTEQKFMDAINKSLPDGCVLLAQQTLSSIVEKNDDSKLKIKSGKIDNAIQPDANCQLSIVNSQLTYLANVANRRAVDFYRSLGVGDVAPAYELSAPRGATLMFCRHCLRYAMGWCPHRGGKLSPYREPYSLVSADGKRFALTFDCKQCVMLVKEK